nr:MAG TPA: hypothetical protein [Caudoviricetes sp.]
MDSHEVCLILGIVCCCTRVQAVHKGTAYV